MGFVSRLLDWQPEKRSMDASALSALRDGTLPGAAVTPGNAVALPTVLSCIRVLAESLGSLPLNLYVRGKRGKFRAYRHPLFSLLRDLPNPEMTSVELRMIMQGHLAAWGNAYAQIVRNRRGDVLELWPMRPDRVHIFRQADGLLWYYYSDDPTADPDVRNVDNWYRKSEIVHLRGLGFDGVMGYSVIRLARQSLELTANAEMFGSKFFENGARPGVILKHPGKLSESAYARLKSSWEKRHQGAENAHRVAIIEEGMDVKEIGIPPGDAQFLETRKFQRSEIAALFRIPPHMVGDLERATFSNIEQQGIEFVTYTLNPWLVIWEQAIYRDLLTVEERKTYFARFNVAGLLRGDTAARYAAYASALANGWMSVNDVREMEDLNEVQNGDQYLRPLNMTPVSTTPNDVGDDQDGTQINSTNQG